jgi:hypothetical protein
VIYLYAVVDAHLDVSGLRGVADEPLTLVPGGQVRAVAGTLDHVPSVSRETLAAQDQIVRALHARGAALLPMRFGAAFAAQRDAEQALAVQSQGLAERLDRVRGREQMSLRITGVRAESPSVKAATGADYLQQRARPRELTPLLDALATLTRATKIERARHEGLVTVYQLVDRGAGDAYRRTVETVTPGLAPLVVHVGGPAPCYAFAGFI